MLIFRKANAGELVEESGLSKLAKLTEIDVEQVGVGGAKNFFEAKVTLFPTTADLMASPYIPSVLLNDIVFMQYLYIAYVYMPVCTVCVYTVHICICLYV